MKAPLDHTADRLARIIHGRGVAVWCGAGISVHSGIPAVAPLIRDIARRLYTAEGDNEALLTSNLPFEAFFDTLSKYTEVGPLLDVYELGAPNPSHIWLARAARRGLVRTICTTNFDTHIESALGLSGLRADVDYRLVYRDHELESIDWDSDKLLLIKLHGSIQNRDELGIFISNLAAGRGLKSRAVVTSKMFSTARHSAIIIIGYSCSDRLDIVPVLASLDVHLDTFYIQHSGEDSASATTSHISDRGAPFLGFSRGDLITCDTDALLRRLSEKVLGENSPPTIANEKVLWPALVDQWWAGASEFGRAMIAGGVLTKVPDPSRARTHYLRAAKSARLQQDASEKPEALIAIATTFFDQGDYKQANLYAAVALDAFKKAKHRRGEGSALTMLGKLCLIAGWLDKALDFFIKSHNLSVEDRDAQGAACDLNLLGVVCRRLGRYEDATKFLECAAEAAVTLGDADLEVAARGNLGNLYATIGRFDLARVHLEHALRMAEALGDLEAAANQLNNLGAVSDAIGKHEDAITFGSRCLEIRRRIFGGEHPQTKEVEHNIEIAKSKL